MKIFEHKCITDGTFYYKFVLNVYVYLTLLLIYYTVSKTMLWPVHMFKATNILQIMFK